MAMHATQRAGARSKRSAVSVGDPILVSKITVPRVPGWVVPRPRITRRITQGARWCPLTVVTGPAGAGKTMALAVWAAAQPGAAAWLSVDEYDNRPGVFWSYVVGALRRSGVVLPRTLSAAARGRAAEHAFLLRLLSALAAQDPPATLILDDFHLLTEPKILSGLDFALRNAGPGLRLVISSRMDPLLPLHRRRLAGELTEIRASDLAFTVSETGQLMAQHGSQLSAASLECLTRRAEGWAAGIRLAALSMDAHPDPDQFVKELIREDSALTSFLVDEVLNTQPREVREVLLNTSILEQVSGEAASVLTGNERAEGILTTLAHTNTFVQPIGGGWFRYHTLFAEVLRLKLRQQFPDRKPALHLRAARWYERNGRLADAVRQAAQAGDWQLAASMVIDGLAVSEIIDPGRGHGLAEEFAGMPPGETWSAPQPYFVSAAAALVLHGPEVSAAALDVAEGCLEYLHTDQEAACRLAAATVRLAIFRRTGNLAGAMGAAASAEVLARPVPGGTPAQHPRMQARLLSARGAVELWSGNLDDAAIILDAGLSTAAESGGSYEEADCLGYLALVEALWGRLDHAADLVALARSALTAHEQWLADPRPNAAALIALAWVHLEHHDLREAGQALKEMNVALTVSPDRFLSGLACFVAARGALLEGNAAMAERYLAKARSGWCVPAWLEQRMMVVEPQVAATVSIHKRPLVPVQRHGALPASSDTSDEPTAPLVFEPLTGREQEVLRHLSDMLSTEEIASEMFISANTVKSHLKSIFRKLAAARRTEAVRRARQLELI
jgi:ATP/maltotriose-dependent transcriptional regulator MalT